MANIPLYWPHGRFFNFFHKKESHTHTRFQIGNLCIIPLWMLHNSGEEMCLTRYNSFINSGIFRKKTTKLPFKLLVLALKKLAVGFLDLNLSAVFGWPSSNWTQADLHQPAAAISFGPTCHAWCPWADAAQGHVNVTILTFWDFGFGWHFEVLVGTENSIQVVFLILKLPFKIAERFESNWLAHIFFETGGWI